MATKRKIKRVVDSKILMIAIEAFFDKMMGGGHQVQSIDATFDASQIVQEYTGFHGWTYDFGGEWNIDRANDYLKYAVVEAIFKHMYPSSFEVSNFNYDQEYWCFSVKYKA